MRMYVSVFALPVALLGMAACKDIGNQELPAGISDPGSYNTEAGAEQMWQYTVTNFSSAFAIARTTVGAFTDEVISNSDTVDKRRLPEPIRGDVPTYGKSDHSVYELLQQVRTNATQTIGTFVKYGPDAPPERRGELLADRGYAEILLADLFCSGIPLSTLNFEGDFTYKPGSSTQEVYEDALVQFDSALTFSSVNDTVLNLARVGKGRALLALGRFAEAAQAVSAVPDGYNFFQRGYISPSTEVADHEGTNGLPYISKRDPRVPLDSVFSNDGTRTFLALQYQGLNLGRLASGVEARLIQAEAALQAKNVSAWLTQLNTLRTTGDIDQIVPDSIDPSRPDTVWHAGTGGVSGLPLLQDPGTDTARVTLMFSERAFWLFGSGQRQGDLRRLIRQYRRTQDHVYPTGLYLDVRHSTYGPDVTMPVPSTEFPNPHFQGCINRDA